MAKEFTAEEMEDLQEAFEIYDFKEEGKLSVDKIGTMFRIAGQFPSQEAVKGLMAKVDPDAKGYFSFESFMTLLKSEWKEIDLEAIVQETFEVFDEDKSGTIDIVELRHVMSNLGERLTDKEINNLMQEADVSGDGLIDLEEFKGLIMGTQKSK